MAFALPPDDARVVDDDMLVYGVPNTISEAQVTSYDDVAFFDVTMTAQHRALLLALMFADEAIWDGDAETFDRIRNQIRESLVNATQ